METRFAAIATTAAALHTIASLGQKPRPFADVFVSESLQAEALALGLDACFYGSSLSAFLSQHWQDYDGFIFSLACGAVVRLIAPLLTHKNVDPAVVVVEPSNQLAISLCGGHRGGGDQLAHQVGQRLSMQTVLSGSSNSLNLPAIDTLGEPFGWVKGEGDWFGLSRAIAQQSPVQVVQDAGTVLWQKYLPDDHPFQFDGSNAESRNLEDGPHSRVWISPEKRQLVMDAELPEAQWHPRVLWIGVGCERNTDRELIERAIMSTCEQNQLAVEAIAGVATLELKSDEPGLLSLCEDRQWPLRCFSADQLKAVNAPNPSEVVAREVGTPSVCEAAAMVAADAGELRVSKQIVKKVGLAGAVTVAIAQSTHSPLAEYTGRKGQLFLVGTGPGSLDQITPAAKAAIGQADVVIGYRLYVDMVRSLFRPGQIVEALPITQERERAERAIALANCGLTVAVISSGDCGIYGMAGLVFEQLKADDWDGQTPGVQVFPGVSALQSAASRVGAPLMHDFCAISLSDLLTPWPVIQTRLRAAAEGDFILALYNPKSKTRTEQIVYAQQVLLAHRSPETPVALTRALYRPEETITLTTLGEMLSHPIDMLTTVLIGNRSSHTYQGWFITPRGYLGGLEH